MWFSFNKMDRMNSKRQVKGKVDDVVEACRIVNSKAMSTRIRTFFRYIFYPIRVDGALNRSRE